jgi:hypothetical protein
MPTHYPTPTLKFNRSTRIKFHFMCMLKTPRNWKFYFFGILRELLRD